MHIHVDITWPSFVSVVCFGVCTTFFSVVKRVMSKGKIHFECVQSKLLQGHLMSLIKIRLVPVKLFDGLWDQKKM